ncbi:hypothetical protein BJY01DRAFT_254267 [Aspergillus pseudoustus]|uniref:Heterokaryon incompatibility domain-containing protein n=1 Tax=Aspergillus pseudoustus TaxID=1810923 RepID=A0ABR4IUB2_9EURO
MDDNESYRGPLTRAQKREQLAAESGCNAPNRANQGIDANSKNNPVQIDRIRSAPLRLVVKPFMQPPFPRAPTQWHALRALLYLLRYGSETSPHRDSAVADVLDRTQRAVLALLEEWWAGRPPDATLPAIKQVLFSSALAFERAPRSEIFNRHFGALEELASEQDLPFLHEVRKRHDAPIETIDDDWYELVENGYHRNLGRLYYNELHPSATLAELELSRNSAGRLAGRDRIGLHALIHVTPYTTGSTPGPCAFSPTKRNLKDFPRPIPAIVSPCRWLGSRQDDDGLPWYLWDIKLCRTVRTAEICQQRIQYAIVSHTWGRLRDGCATERVRGVPWRVPRITCYNVKQLPQMIRDAGFSESYIWLDLFCIPQEMSVAWQLEICKAELPRQLAIFSNSSTAVIWLNDVSGWDNTRSPAAWLGLKYLSLDLGGSASFVGIPGVEEALGVAARSASCPCDLDVTKRKSIGADDGAQETIPPAWLTSLWTLQEITIRPDMILLDKHWRPLAIGNKLLITLDNLISLVGEVSRPPDAPEGVATLVSVHDQHMRSLGQEVRLSPLVLGARRVSTSPRAPAIMSAVGATKWFSGRTLQQFQSPEEADQLVLGSYPLDFVEEVCNLSGAAFFSCWTNIATFATHGDTRMEPAPGYPLRGTMLPFMPIPVDQRDGDVSPNPDLSQDADHPSVRSWQVQRDGSVTLPTVALVSSNSIELQVSCELRCMIQGNNPENTTLRHAVICQDELPLDDWVHRFRGEAHAICTMFSQTKLVGIILHCVGTSDSFIKAGTFSYEWPNPALGDDDDDDGEGQTWVEPGFITVLDVNWHVL